jgi:hypothetical protein
MDVIHEFFSTGSQYYVASRFAVWGGLNPVVGNLTHHAIEMYLKGALSKTKKLNELRDLNHRLPAIWAAFKVQANDAALNRFDKLIEEVHKFEELRYPDPNSKGMLSIIDAVRPPPMKQTGGNVSGL